MENDNKPPDPEKCTSKEVSLTRTEEDLALEDWKMTKDRIKHFDSKIFSNRIQGISIVTGFQTAAFGVSTLAENPFFEINGSTVPMFSILMLSSFLVLIPVIVLNILYFQMLEKAVQHAKHLEEDKFNCNIKITWELTTKYYTFLHYIGSYLIFGILGVMALLFFILSLSGKMIFLE